MLTTIGPVEHIMQLVEMLAQEQLPNVTMYNVIVLAILFRFEIGMRHVFFVSENSRVRTRKFSNDVTGM